MATSDMEYSVDQEIADFFEKTGATRAACDAYARQHLGGDIIPVTVQGVCSYTVYAGSNANCVAQFRLKSLQLRMETANLARTIHGHFVPQVTFKGEIREDVEGKEPLYIYVMNRVLGITHLDFILANNSLVPQNSPEFSCWRKNLVTDVARFFAVSWNAPQDVDQTYQNGLRHQYEKELGLLLASLPDRFHPLIQESLDSLPAIFSLPMVLLHEDFGDCNILVDEASCNLVGVVDWAEAKIAPFGLNLYSHQRLISKIHLKNGWVRYDDYAMLRYDDYAMLRYDDYAMLEETFWSTFSREAGGLGNETIRVIKAARITGLLLCRGFTPRFANMPEPVPI